jgi:hypothetical protein
MIATSCTPALSDSAYVVLPICARRQTDIFSARLDAASPNHDSAAMCAAAERRVTAFNDA